MKSEIRSLPGTASSADMSVCECMVDGYEWEFTERLLCGWDIAAFVLKFQ